MDRATRPAEAAIKEQSKAAPPPERRAMRRAVDGLEGFDAQFAALLPPDVAEFYGGVMGHGEPKKDTKPASDSKPGSDSKSSDTKSSDTKSSDTKTSDTKSSDTKAVAPETKPQAPETKPQAPETKPQAPEAKTVAPEMAQPVESDAAEPDAGPKATDVKAGAEAEMAKVEQSVEAVVATKAPPDKGAAPAAKAKTGGGGAHKTKGPEDLVATYGTVAEADKRQGKVTVKWVEGLKTEKRGRKEHKIAEARDDVEQLEPKTQSIPVHEKLAPTFQSIFADIDKSGDWRFIWERPWAHNARQNRNKSTEWSVHSWGTAIDVNPTTNPNAPGMKGYSPTQGQKKIAEHFKSRGFTWLKDSDAMHFQYHTGGTPQISDAEIDMIVDDDARKERDKTFPGTSRESLASNIGSNLKRKKGELGKVERLLAKARAKTPPTNARKLKKHLKYIEDQEKNVAALKWWVQRYEQILAKLAKKPASAG